MYDIGDDIRKERPSYFDVDNTLLLWKGDVTEPGDNKIEMRDLNNDVYYLTPNKMLIDLLKLDAIKGYYIVIWSNRGYNWSVEARNKLKLNNYVDECLAKPVRMFDDENPQDFLPKPLHFMDNK